MAFQKQSIWIPPDFEVREHMSPTGVKSLISTPRAVAFRKILGLRKMKEDAWLALGKAVHKQLENYGQGKDLDLETVEGQRALACLHLLPNPREGSWETEAPITLNSQLIAPELEPIVVRGERDMAWGSGWTWVLYDYKTSRGDKKRKDPWGYQITPEKLAEDPQGNLYSLAIMLSKGVQSVPARWVTILTDLDRHPDARATDYLFTYEHAFDRAKKYLVYWDAFRNIIRRLKPLQQQNRQFELIQEINKIPCNTSECESFGGCPYRSANGGPCKDNRSLGEMMTMQANGPGGQPMTAVEQMLASQAAQNGGPSVPGGYGGAPGGYPPPPAPQGPPQGPPPGMPGIPQGYGAPQQGQPMAPAQQWGPPAPAGPPQGFGAPPQGYGPPHPQGTGYQPPQGPAGYQPPHAPHLPPEAHQQPQMPPAQHPMAAQGGQPALPGMPPGGVPSLPQAPAAAPAKRGRKPKAAVPATQGLTEEDADDRSAFMRLFLCEHFRGLALQIDPNHAQQLLHNATSLANLAWQTLEAAGA